MSDSAQVQDEGRDREVSQLSKYSLTSEVVSNVVFGVAVLCATWGEVSWLAYGVVGFVWLMLSMYFLASLPPRRKAGSQPPRWWTRLFDVLVFGHFIYFEWYWTACAYAASCVLLGVSTQSPRDINRS